ncbi:MAG: hypothetical protein DMF61_00035 [Blastocatellia bacterium AA13]|nr:MAG: hypothetical protein DMF61_00035 [Blastocatellia bacterium AA13]
MRDNDGIGTRATTRYKHLRLETLRSVQLIVHASTKSGLMKAREPARILVAIGNNQSKGYHLEFKGRWLP